jgi:alpha-L-fucosidase 2
MKKTTFIILMLLGIGSSTMTAMDNDNTNRLWDNKPAKLWLEALPIGNGFLGGMVYGGTSTDELQLN